ncbi:hypothetical protein ZYGM_000496 [Zygosaccharomyces mellis]|uniref:Uncharacterized protein n=1 Tax=Zygosaccharomyces mellis TaxID=42258 RepID=A0A4C2EEX8_9SACH|nr:hypothetical protein ZYGM_000496 [Zygosaccharomyces mellis]
MNIVPRVYSLVNNSIASLLAYEIAQLPNQPKVSQVVLLLNDRYKLNRFLDNDSKLLLQNSEGLNFHQTQFMASDRPPVYSSGEIAAIDNLIVSAKHSMAMIRSIQKFKNSLNCNSNVLLLNPPFGTVEQLYRNIWPQEERPNIILGVTPAQDPFYATEPTEFHLRLRRKNIPLRMSPLPKTLSNYNHEQAVQDLEKFKQNNDLMKVIQSASQNHKSPIEFDLTLYTHDELLLMRLENLIILSCIKPLAFLFDCYSKSELLGSRRALDIIHKLIKEQIFILLSSYPFLVGIPHCNIALDADRLYEQVIRFLRGSRVNYLNKLECNNSRELTGYFVQLAYHRKLNCRWNQTITTLAQGKTEFQKHRALNYLHLR